MPEDAPDRMHTPGYEPLYTPKDFSDKLLPGSKEMPIILFINAGWCGPCRAMQPKMAELACDYNGKFSFWELCSDENDSEKITGKYGIRAIPAIVIFKDSQVIEQIIGAVSRSIIERAMKKAL